jgi:hypothetical protein
MAHQQTSSLGHAQDGSEHAQQSHLPGENGVSRASQVASSQLEAEGARRSGVGSQSNHPPPRTPQSTLASRSRTSSPSYAASPENRRPRQASVSRDTALLGIGADRVLPSQPPVELPAIETVPNSSSATPSNTTWLGGSGFDQVPWDQGWAPPLDRRGRHGDGDDDGDMQQSDNDGSLGVGPASSPRRFVDARANSEQTPTHVSQSHSETTEGGSQE